MKGFSTVFRLTWKMQWGKLFGTRSEKKRNRYLLPVVFGVVLILFNVMFSLATSFIAKGVAGYNLSTEILTLVQLVGSSLTLLFTALPMLGTLFLNKDNDFYATLPVKSSTVFAAKMIKMFLNEVLFTFGIFFIPLLVFGICAGHSVAFYFGIVLIMFIMPSIPMFLGSLLCVPLTFIASFFKSRGVLAGVFALIAICGLFGLYFWTISTLSAGDGSAVSDTNIDFGAIADLLKESMTTVNYVFLPMYAISCFSTSAGIFGLLGASAAVVELLLGIFIPLILFAISFFLAKVFYARAASAMQENSKRLNKVGTDKTSGVYKALFVRDFKSLLRVPSFLISYFLPMLFCIIFPLIFGFIFGKSFLTSTDGSTESIGGLTPEAFGNLFTTFIMFMMLILMSASFSGSSSTAFSRDGKALSTLRAFPIEPKVIVRSKMIMQIIPAGVGMVIGYIISVVMGHPSVAFAIPAFIQLAITLYAVQCFSLHSDLRAPNTSWTSPSQLQKVRKNSMISLLLVFAVMILDILPCAMALFLPAFFNVPAWSLAIIWIGFIGVTLGLAVWQHLSLFKNAEEDWNRIGENQ